ncbi:unnamed protein product [Sphagnum balticum]
MKIVYESVQISINSKQVLIKPEKSILKGKKKSITRLVDFEREVNEAKYKDNRENKEGNRESKDSRESSLKFPDFGFRKEPVSAFPILLATKEPPAQAASEEQSSTICYNDYIRNNYIDLNISQQDLGSKLSQ